MYRTLSEACSLSLSCGEWSMAKPDFNTFSIVPCRSHSSCTAKSMILPAIASFKAVVNGSGELRINPSSSSYMSSTVSLLTLFISLYGSESLITDRYIPWISRAHSGAVMPYHLSLRTDSISRVKRSFASCGISDFASLLPYDLIRQYMHR